MPYKFGFLDYEQPRWEQYFEEAQNAGLMRDIERESGLSEKQIKKVLEMMYEYRIIN
jgi:hypothetical protein